MVCKVADFGMSRELTDDDAYNTTVRLPVLISIENKERSVLWLDNF